MRFLLRLLLETRRSTLQAAVAAMPSMTVTVAVKTATEKTAAAAAAIVP